MQSEKRHLLGYAQPSNSTPSPTMPPGRSQARADAFRHNATVCGLMQEYTLRSDATNPRRSAYIPPNAIDSSSPPDMSKKRHFLGYPKPPSLTLPLGRFQTRAGDFPFVQGISDMASTEWLATSPWHSFDGSLGGIPATITSEVADTGIGWVVEEHREQPEVLPPQGTTATSTDLGAQGDQEEFWAASPMDAEKSTSNSEPKLDPEPHSTTASDGKEVGAVEAESDGIDPMSPLPSIGAVDDIKFLDTDPTESDESRTPSGKEQADASLHNHPSPKTLQERCYLEAAPEPQVVVTPLDHSQHGSVDIPPNAINSVSPPDVSKKRHPLGYPKPPSPTLPPGRSQTRAGDFPSVLEMSGMASTERLTTSPRRSPDELRGTLATITSEVADTGIGSGVEKHREQPRVPPPQGVRYLPPIAAMDGKDVDAVVIESDGIDPTSRMAKHWCCRRYQISRYWPKRVL
ncbi:hypothetical protein PISMIDRAFT_230030 [Pisolithus microcarpus 441]|uniref:Uncharacterized protein n=1 Tax=Pisolithus microcarpus 441 TaxID=765257 RepID=A0A0C9YTC9_9AGAM|nr:hypothetical protein BKA83DRAFT_230030 [Pisolithus microcarpus]KIK17299.1 hypothetical protein PISMIDRAFT_230030 [Pisolithus microcarpus 441]